MGANGTAKKRGMEHYLHRQWLNTTVGKERHAEDVKRQRALPVKPKLVRVCSKNEQG